MGQGQEKVARTLRIRLWLMVRSPIERAAIVVGNTRIIGRITEG